ncbi:MAG: hypothetical protein JW973_03305 [Bacteroidales bacterium]|nr:hypothetical protein [Bacteroidales bacterium]
MDNNKITNNFSNPRGIIDNSTVVRPGGNGLQVIFSTTGLAYFLFYFRLYEDQHTFVFNPKLSTEIGEVCEKLITTINHDRMSHDNSVKQKKSPTCIKMIILNVYNYY